MPTSNGGDDTPLIIAASIPCLTNSTILFSAHTTYNLLTPLSFTNLLNVKLSFEGNISLSTNVTEVRNVVTNASVYPGHWITVKGTDVVFAGSKGSGGWFLGA